MKRVAFFMPTLGGGGAERVMLDLAHGLAKCGHEVWLLVASAQGSLVHAVPPSVKLVDLRVKRVVFALHSLGRWLQKHRPDALVASQSHANIIAYFARQIARADCQLILREESTPSINLRHLRGLRSYLWKCLLRYVYQHANVVVAVSKDAGADLQTYLGCKLNPLQVIYNPVITPEIYQKAYEPLNHPWFQEGAKIPVILAVGRLNTAKNYPLLLNAFAQLLHHQPARLLILGEGEERSSLELLIQELGLSKTVSLHGFDSNPFKYMKRCSLYVMSSDWEGLPGSLIQALALCGNVVSTKCPSGPAEVLKNGQFGRLVNLNDSNDLSAALLSSLGKTKSRLSTDIIEHLKNFESTEVIKKYIKIFNFTTTRR